MRHIVIVACLALPLFSIYLINGTTFRKKKVTEHELCVWFSLQLLSETFLIARRNARDTVKYIGLRVKYALFLSEYNET
jgi:hypothetical protein